MIPFGPTLPVAGKDTTITLETETFLGELIDFVNHSLVRIPAAAGHLFRFEPDTCSDFGRTLIPEWPDTCSGASGHP